MKNLLLTMLCGLACHYPIFAQADDITDRVSAVEAKVITWRRDIHQHPELSNQEQRTASLVAKHLRHLGFKVETEIAKTGVVGLLEGAKPGPTVLLRADMDALPVTEKVDLPFRSRAKGTYHGVETGIMHACGHDTHVAMLMGAAEVLSQYQSELAGNVLFVFQPAEEGTSDGELGGAERMLHEGLFDKYHPDVAFGLHTWSQLHTGELGYKAGPLMAGVDQFDITVLGKQTHGSTPWDGADPIVTAAQIITSIQTIVSRQINITKEPAVISFGKIQGGIRNNIIPDKVELVGTIRNFDETMRQQIFTKIKTIAENVAAANGAIAKVKISEGYPVTVNNQALLETMLPSISTISGSKAIEVQKVTGAEDFSYFAAKIPAVFLFLGGTPPDIAIADAASNHSPLFFVDENTLKVGTEALTRLTLDYTRLASS